MDTDIFNGFPTHIDRIGELLRICLQRDHKLGMFVENYLAENIKDLKSPRFVPKKEDIIQGMIGIGRYDDDQYYRIKVLDRTLQGNVVNVLFIDYGNRAVLPLSDIRLLHYELNKALLNIPPLAITCFLENVAVNKPWNEEEFNTLKKLVLYDERQCMMRQLPNGVKVVNIYFHNANQRLTEIILENDMGTPVTDAELMAKVSNLSSRGSYEDRQVQKPTNTLQQYTQRLSYSNDNYISERALSREVTYNFSSSHMLPVDSMHNAYISHMEDGPYSFSLQLKSSAEDALPRLSILLKQEEPVLNTRPLLPGTMVMTSSRSDNSFRRSIVVNVKRNFCHVYHMDYGSNEEIPFSEIYQLPSMAQHAPAMALRFCLADIKSMKMTDSAKSYFQELLLHKQVLIKVAAQESEGPLLQYCEMFYEGRNVKDIIAAFSAPLEYTSQHPPRGKDIKVTVSHIHSPSLFFIQYNSKLDVINRIQESVEIHCKQQPRLRELANLSIGTPVAALYDDNVWYRGMIVGLNKDNVQILYVDYGNRNDVPANNLCQISRDLVTKWRAQAVECCLQGFENDNTNQVEQEVLDVMEETLNQNFSMTPILILPGNRYVVELVDELGGKLSEKIKQAKPRSSQPPEAPPTQPSQDSNYSDLDTYPVDGNVRNSRSKGKNENLFVRPSVRPLIEQHNKPYTHEHDDRCDDYKPKGFNRQSSFEQPPRFSKGDEPPRRGRDTFDEQKPSSKFTDKSNDWGDSLAAADRSNLGNTRDSFSNPPSHDSFGTPFSRSTPNDEDDKGFGERPRRRDRMGGNSDSQTKPFGRSNRNNNWGGTSPDVGDGCDNVKGGRNDSQPKWNSAGDSLRNEERTRPSDRSNDRPRYSRGNNEYAPQRSDKNDDNSNVWNDKTKWSGDRDNERPKREGGNRFNERKSDNGDFGGNKFSGKRNRDDFEADRRRDDGEFGGNRHERKREEGYASGNRFGERRREDLQSGGNRFGDKRRDDADGGGNRHGDRRRNDESGGNRFGDRWSDAGEGTNTRFSGKRREDGESGGGRFNAKRWDDAPPSQERRGGKFRDNEAPGRREGGRYNKDNDFRKKRFDDSGKSADSGSVQHGGAGEDWGDVEAPVKVSKPQVVGSYPTRKVAANSELQVTVSSVVNPHLFYVWEAGCDPELDKMRAAIDNLGQGLVPLKEDSLAPGAPVLARFSEDQALYRGTVKSLIKSSKAQILFVDYGNYENVNFSELFYMPAEILNKPPIALHCTLADINPANMKWSEDPSAFDAYLNAEETLTMNVSLVKMVDGEMVITAKLTNSSGVSVSQMLIDASLALPGTPSAYTHEPTGVVDGSLKASIQPSDTEIPATGDVLHKDLETQAVDKWIDRFNLLVGHKFYGEILEAENGGSFPVRLIDAKVVTLATLVDHQSPLCIMPGLKAIIGVEGVIDDRLKVALYGLDGIEKAPFIDEKTASRKINPLCSFPVVRSTETITISHVEDTTVYIQRVADIDKLAELLEETYDFYNDSIIEEIDWSVGDLCCAKSLLDENWYRAVIISTTNEYTVNYLDYGNSEALPKENLRKLDKKFYFPQFALGVSLAVEWNSPQPPLMDLTAGEEFVSKFINDHGKWLVDLTFSSGKSLNDLLVEKNIAQEKPDDPFKEINSAIGYDLTAGSKIPILVSHADSPSMFWVHKQSHINKVDELQEKLQAVIEGAPDALESDIVFAAQYSADGVWYRATKVNEDTLRFIDYGNTDVLVSPKKLPDEMVKPLSGYAISMYLCVKPVNGDWTDEAIKEFEIFIEQQNIVAEIINVNYKVIVDLREGDQLLSKILIDSGHAVYCDFVSNAVKNYSKLQTPDSFTHRIFGDSPSESQNILEAQKIENIPGSNVNKAAKIETIPESNVNQVAPVKVYVTHSNSVNDFYIQEDSKSDMIDSVQNSLFEIGEFEQASEVKVGQLYCIKYEDEQWYRARLLSTEPEINVLLIDYGNNFVPSDLRVLPEKLISEKPLATHCSLGVEESSETNSRFEELINGGLTPINMTVLSPGSPTTVRLSDDEGTNVLDILGILSTNVTIPKENQCASKQKIFITHVYGPDCFYAQTEQQLSKSEELSVQMSNAENFKRLERMLVGDVIAVLFPDDSCWYRGEVLTFAPDIIVRFIDYGNTSVVTEYRELPSELKEIECLTMKCSLQLPEDLLYWPEACAELFAITCAMNPEKLQMEVISQSSDFNVVKLYLNDIPLTKSLIDEIDATVQEESITNISEAPSSTNLESKKAGRGYITHINSISDFYVQKEDCADLLRQIQDGLSSLDDNVNSKPDCGIGSLIATKFVDGEWYRGQILQIGAEIRVRFVDYGNECNVSEISMLPKDLIEIPPVAMMCSLEIEGKHLKENAKKIFKKLCGDAETLFDFTIKSQKDGVNIVEIILNNKNVLSELITDNSVSENQDETSNKAKKTSVSEDTASELVGKQIKGYISHIKSANGFYIQEQSTAESLLTVQASLKETSSVKKSPSTCEVGDLIVAKYTDGNWYRAEVIEISPEIKVRFIDYGNESVVSEISTLTSQLLEMPAAALRCSLELGDSNIDQLNESFSKLRENPDALYDFHIVSNSNGLCIVKVLLDGEDILEKLKGVRTFHEQEVERVTGNELGGVSVEELEKEIDKCIDSSGLDGSKNKEISSSLDESPVKLSKNEDISESKNSSLETNDIREIAAKLESVNEKKTSIFPYKFIPFINNISDFYVINSDIDIKPIEKTLLGAEDFEDSEGVNVDDIMAGKTSDGTWFRCKVLNVSSDNYNVFLIDHGQVVTANKLKELPTNLILIEPRALHCSLYCPEGISYWPEDLLNIFITVCQDVIRYEVIDDSVSPTVVKLISSQGDVSTMLAAYCDKNDCANLKSPTENEGSNLNNLKDDLLLQKVETVKEDTNATEEKKLPRKSLPSKPVKTLAEIKANAKPRIVTRSQGASPVDRKLMKSETRSPSEPRLQEIHAPEHLQQPLFVRTTSFDDRPVPGCLSNPSSPTDAPSSQDNKDKEVASTPHSSTVHSSPRHSIVEKIVPGSISGIVADRTDEDKD